MAVKFLSEDWINAVNGTLTEDAAYQSATESTEITLQFVVTDGPGGDVEYNVSAAGGATSFAARNPAPASA